MDDELLAPPGATPTDAAAGRWYGADGFTDSRQAIRLWVDEDTRQLQQVHLSPRWRDKLAQHSLAEACQEAFFLANMRFGVETPNLRIPEPEVEPDPALDGATTDELLERFQTLHERLAEIESRPPEDVRWSDFEGEPTQVTGRGGHVTVRLSLAGLTESIDFDRAWLRSASDSEIGEAILATHRKAYAAYVPPVHVPGEREELAMEFEQLRLALRTEMPEGIA